jgi:hypothetical protein
MVYHKCPFKIISTVTQTVYVEKLGFIIEAFFSNKKTETVLKSRFRFTLPRLK